MATGIVGGAIVVSCTRLDLAIDAQATAALWYRRARALIEVGEHVEATECQRRAARAYRAVRYQLRMHRRGVL